MPTKIDKIITTIHNQLRDNTEIDKLNLVQQLLSEIDHARMWKTVKQYAREREVSRGHMKNHPIRLVRQLVTDDGEDHEPDPFAPKPGVRQYL